MARRPNPPLPHSPFPLSAPPLSPSRCPLAPLRHSLAAGVPTQENAGTYRSISSTCIAVSPRGSRRAERARHYVGRLPPPDPAQTSLHRGPAQGSGMWGGGGGGGGWEARGVGARPGITGRCWPSIQWLAIEDDTGSGRWRRATGWSMEPTVCLSFDWIALLLFPTAQGRTRTPRFPLLCARHPGYRAPGRRQERPPPVGTPNGGHLLSEQGRVGLAPDGCQHSTTAESGAGALSARPRPAPSRHTTGGE